MLHAQAGVSSHNPREEASPFDRLILFVFTCLLRNLRLTLSYLLHSLLHLVFIFHQRSALLADIERAERARPVHCLNFTAGDCLFI